MPLKPSITNFFSRVNLGINSICLLIPNFLFIFVLKVDLFSYNNSCFGLDWSIFYLVILLIIFQACFFELSSENLLFFSLACQCKKYRYRCKCLAKSLVFK